MNLKRETLNSKPTAPSAAVRIGRDSTRQRMNPVAGSTRQGFGVSPATAVATNMGVDMGTRRRGDTANEVSAGSGSDRVSSGARPKSINQLRAIYGEAKRRGLDSEQLHELALSVLSAQSSALKSGSLADLTYVEAEKVIARLKGKSFVPRRTQQYRRKKSNVSQIMTPEQRDLIAALATQRNWNAGTLQSFCVRQCGHYVRTTTDANKVIEALKAMNRRDHLWAA